MQLESRLQRLEDEVAKNIKPDTEEYPLNAEERRQYLRLLIKRHNEEPLTREEKDQIDFYMKKTSGYSSRHPVNLTSWERERCIELILKMASGGLDQSEAEELQLLEIKMEGV